jgi:TonB family protein
VTTLLESKARPYGSRKGAVVSMVLHGALIGGAVVASGKAVLPDREKLEEHSVLFVAPPPPKVHTAPEPPPEPKKPPPAAKQPRAEPPRVRAPTPPRQVATPAPRPTQTVIAPTSVPVNLPPVNLKAAPTVDVDIRVAPPEIPTSASKGSLVKTASDGDVEGRSGGTKGGLGSGASNKAYSESQVDRAVVATRAAQPRYPDALRSVNVTGEVMVQYIVDARGRVEPGSIKILSTTHPLFGEAVRRALLEARYRPAQAGGENVRQLVEQPFIFKLQE